MTCALKIRCANQECIVAQALSGCWPNATRCADTLPRFLVPWLAATARVTLDLRRTVPDKYYRYWLPKTHNLPGNPDALASTLTPLELLLGRSLRRSVFLNRLILALANPFMVQIASKSQVRSTWKVLVSARASARIGSPNQISTQSTTQMRQKTTTTF